MDHHQKDGIIGLNIPLKIILPFCYSSLPSFLCLAYLYQYWLCFKDIHIVTNNIEKGLLVMGLNCWAEDRQYVS